MITLYTIGFTKKSADIFFTKLNQAGVSKIIDIRLNNISQLAGFTKKEDLTYFLRNLCNCSYSHQPILAPTNDILDDYRKKKIDWSEYAMRFRRLLENRAVETIIPVNELQNSCLLCSEPTAEKCHRKLVAEYFRERFPDIKIEHL